MAGKNKRVFVVITDEARQRYEERPAPVEEQFSNDLATTNSE